MKRSINASARFLMSARSALESGEVAQTLFDIGAVLFCVAFVVLTACAVAWSFFILFFGWL